jgi:hypothetical protein
MNIKTLRWGKFNTDEVHNALLSGDNDWPRTRSYLIRGWNMKYSLQHQAQISSQVHFVSYLRVCYVPVCKLSEREADHSRLFSAEVNSE